MTESPVWLADEPEIQALLHAVVDRFDEQPGAERQRPIYIDVAKQLPVLQRGDANADQTWALIERLIALRVCTPRSTGRRNPLDPAWSGVKLAFAPACDPILRMWLQRARSVPASQSWCSAVQDHAHAFEGDVQTLLQRRIAIPGRSDAEVVVALARAAQITGPISLRQLSSQLFWGQSKLLDDRADLLATLFPRLQLRERPIVAAVHLPAVWEGALFIENQDSYALAVSGAMPETAPLALIYAAGFRSTATRIRSRDGVLLHYAGPGADRGRDQFERWWYDDVPSTTPVYFWGDLDFAGMQILKALRSRFPGSTAWRPGYDPMLVALEHGRAHSRDGKNAQTDPIETGCSHADSVLLPAIRQFGYVDQELVSTLVDISR
jgi:hypothetical protein